VLQAINERDKLALQAKKEVDEVWVVFDKDDANANKAKTQNFNDAFEIADQHNFEVAYTNEAFELWLLLHLTNLSSTAPIPRKEIYEMLEGQIRKISKYSDYKYDHKKPNPKTIEIIAKIGNEDLAIKRAEALLQKQNGIAPIQVNPSTKVHLLVQQLRYWISYFNY
jgi:RloB-like protein